MLSRRSLFKAAMSAIIWPGKALVPVQANAVPDFKHLRPCRDYRVEMNNHWCRTYVDGQLVDEQPLVLSRRIALAP